MRKTKFGDFFVIFVLGGFMYGLIEVMTRGYTHPSMLLAGGICFLGMFWLSRKPINFIIKCIISGIIIIIVEFLFGVIFNILLGLNVWDYSDQAFNILGQVCLKFFVLWCGLSALGLAAARFLDVRLV